MQEKKFLSFRAMPRPYLSYGADFLQQLASTPVSLKQRLYENSSKRGVVVVLDVRSNITEPDAFVRRSWELKIICIKFELHTVAHLLCEISVWVNTRKHTHTHIFTRTRSICSIIVLVTVLMCQRLSVCIYLSHAHIMARWFHHRLASIDLFSCVCVCV